MMPSHCYQSHKDKKSYELEFKGTEAFLWHQEHQHFISSFITQIIRPLRFRLTCLAKHCALKILLFTE